MRAAATVVSSWISAFVVSGGASGRDADPTRSGWRDAARTGNPWSSRCRTIRRPRKPVPPKTVMSARWPAALWVRSSAMAVSRHAHRDDLSRASPTQAERLHLSMLRRPYLSTSSPEHRGMDLERKADNHPDAEPPRGSERRASLKPERGSVEKVPRNRKRQSRSALSLLRGTDGSNPASSSGESRANPVLARRCSRDTATLEGWITCASTPRALSQRANQEAVPTSFEGQCNPRDLAA